MKRDEILKLISEVQNHQSELNNVEVKSAIEGTPQRLFEAFSAFANCSGGGIIIFGLDEGKNFKIVGVNSVSRLQQEISQISSAEMEPVLRLEFTVEEIEGRKIVVVEIPEVSVELRPCYYKPVGLQKGSYIRVGNTNRRMSDYEIFGYVSARTQPLFDEDVVNQATMDDLDRQKLEEYLVLLRRARPDATYLNESFERLLSQLKIIKVADGIPRPTLAGLLVFGKYPQSIEPQLMITFLQYYGTTETEKTPRGERFLDNRKFEGHIPAMVEGVVNHILATIRKSSLIEGLYRRDIPEYPEESIREAVVNAVAHRDYSHFARGSHIQIRLFADRLEIQSPGGLYGSVTEETLEGEQSTRNRVLVRLMEDLHLVENRGSGIRAMIDAMRKANLEPPRFHDKRSSFWVTFHNHTLMGPEAVKWLNQFSDQPLNDHQRVALAYLKHNERMTNSDYQRLSYVDSVTANRELRSLVELNLVAQNSTRRWAYYTLKVIESSGIGLQLEKNEEKILEYVRKNGFIKRSDCQKLVGVSEVQARYILRKMSSRKLLRKEGQRRGSKYVLA